jgi:Protein of unknown function (DUF4238)
MSNSRKHHFVPTFYLTRWEEYDGRVTQWSRQRTGVARKRRHPEGTGWELDLYAFDDLRPEFRQWFETTFLTLTDDLGSIALEKMLTDGPNSLDLRLRSAWARFVMTLRFRTPDVVNELRTSTARAWESNEPHSEEEYQRMRKGREGYPVTFAEYSAAMTPAVNAQIHVRLLKSAMDNRKIGEHINRMHWSIYDAESADCEFLTSDWASDLNLLRGVVSLPIGPTRLFIASDTQRGLNDMLDQKPNDVVRIVNRFVVEQARRFVWSRGRSQQRFIENRMSRSMVPEPFFPNLGAL